MFLQLDRTINEDVELGDLDLSVYVKEENTEMEKMRNKLMTYIGGQYKIQCYEHKYPLVVSNNCEGKCYQVIDNKEKICTCNIT